jgi:hypothetical protein
MGSRSPSRAAGMRGPPEATAPSPCTSPTTRSRNGTVSSGPERRGPCRAVAFSSPLRSTVASLPASGSTEGGAYPDASSRATSVLRPCSIRVGARWGCGASSPQRADRSVSTRSFARPAIAQSSSPT